MKGFTKGKGAGRKFIPTNNKKGSALSKKDLQKNVSNTSPDNSDLRQKKTVDEKPSEIKIESINVFTLDNFGIKYHIDSDGEVNFDGDIGTALEKMGAKKLTEKDIGVLIDDDSENTDITTSQFYKDPKDAVGEYLAEKTEDHTQNFGSILGDDYGFGFFKVDGKELMAVRPQHNDDGEGIYDIGYIEDVEGVGKENKRFYATSLVDPHLDIKFTYKGETFTVRKDNGREGFNELLADDGGSADKDVHNEIFGDYGENIEEAIRRFKK